MNIVLENPVDRERLRRQSILRVGLLVCLILVFLDGGVQQHSDPTSTTRGTTNYNPSHANPDIPVPYLKWLNQLTHEIGENLTAQFPRNCSGLYNGAWTKFSRTGNTVVISNPVGNLLLQLRSVALIDIPGMDFVYGVIKLYKAGDKSDDVLYPLQGVFLASTGEVTLLSSSDISEWLYLEIPAIPPTDGSNSNSNMSILPLQTKTELTAKRHVTPQEMESSAATILLPLGSSSSNYIVLHRDDDGSNSSHSNNH